VPKSRLKALLQPFTPLLVSWSGKNELCNMQSAEAGGLPILLKGRRLLKGFYLNELLIRLLQKNDPHPELYTIYENTLLKLAEKSASNEFAQKTLRLFEKQLLHQLGYGLHFQQDFKDECFYQFYLEEGFKIVTESVASEALIFSGNSLRSFAQDVLEDSNSLKDAKRLMRIVLQSLLGQHPLQSRKLFIEV
jgi:DNA repair protein RecO (recombination protein O)